ncbi:sigma-54 interaction domain-containing protein [Bacillus dakarensis]|uniref:sigma-54 interaction domain-containing protein n=1 Tax=Robertmurraya dakarensis TaxID=1926278 RepID=UPI003B01B68B
MLILNLITNTHPFNMVIVDRDGKIQSSQLEQELFYQSNIKDKPFKGLFDEWEELGSNIILASCNDQRYLLLTDHLHEDGSQRIYIMVEGEGVHALKQQVKELDKSIRQLDAIIESSYDGIYITDAEGNTLKTNSAIERLTGIPKEYYIGKNMDDLIKRGILQESVTKKVLETRQAVTVVQENFNGKETLLTGNPILNEQDEIEIIVTNIRDLSELNQLNLQLKKAEKLNEKYKEELKRLKATANQDKNIILKNEKMIKIYEMIERIADFDTTILVLGESGVGKDVLVRHFYQNSPRSKNGQLVKVNCGAIPKDLLESELFGYEGGAFSGANRSGKAGMFELAENGILFLDEIGELSLELQVKLLRAIQEKEFMRVGGTKLKKVDTQLIAATNRDLKEMVRKGLFREDLYYRLNVVPISVPPLRERQDDILPLIHHFLEQYSQKYHLSKEFDYELNQYFYYYNWPGNIRELSNLIERLILTVPHELITVDDLPDEYKNHSAINLVSSNKELSLKEVVDMAEKLAIEKAFHECKSTYEIAEKLKTSQPTIVRKLKKYQLSF